MVTNEPFVTAWPSFVVGRPWLALSRAKQGPQTPFLLLLRDDQRGGTPPHSLSEEEGKGESISGSDGRRRRGEEKRAKVFGRSLASPLAALARASATASANANAKRGARRGVPIFPVRRGGLSVRWRGPLLCLVATRPARRSARRGGGRRARRLGAGWLAGKRRRRRNPSPPSGFALSKGPEPRLKVSGEDGSAPGLL